MIAPRSSNLRGALAELRRSRWWIPYFGRLFLRKRYARTWLGLLWVPLRPFISVSSRILVFGGVVGISAPEAPYPIMFLVATAAWQLFAETAYWATRSLELGRTVTREVEVPRLPILTAGALPGVLEFLVYAAMAAAAVGYYVARAGILYIHISVNTLLVPAGLLLALLLGLGVGLLTSALGARARDVRFGLTFALSFLYFLTPVLYPLSLIPNRYKPLAELNPMTGAIEMVKDGIFASHELSPDAVLVTVLTVVALWLPGLWLFHRADVDGAVRRGGP